MKEVTSDLEQQKKQRAAEFQENQQLRAKIQGAINDYKKKEEEYQQKMESHGKLMQSVEKKLKEAIEGSITTTLKQAESEKALFTRSCENVKELGDKINGYMEKFVKIKEEMNTNAKKFEGYQSDIETKKLNIQCLETEIQNIQMGHLKSQKLTLEIEEDKKKMTQ